MFFCKWDFCPRSFTTLTDLRTHFKEDHIPREQPVFIPSHARQRRADGAWILTEQSFTLDLANTSSNASSSFPISDPNSSFMPSTAASNLNFVTEEKEVDFDAFLRSPTPIEANNAPQMSPLQGSGWGQPMVFPSPIQTQAHAQQTPSAPSQVSSAAAVSPADNMAMPTQAPEKDSPVILSFGSVASPSSRRFSGGGVGFEWGVGK